MNSKYILSLSLLLSSGSAFSMLNISDLKKVKTVLETTVKNGINQAIKELSNAYILIQEKVVQGTAAPIADLQEKTNGLQQTLDYLRNIPEKALKLADINDLKGVLDYLISLMNEFETSLTVLRDDFSKASQDLNPHSDPLLIYKDFRDALKNFNQATQALQDLIETLESL